METPSINDKFAREAAEKYYDLERRGETRSLEAIILSAIERATEPFLKAARKQAKALEGAGWGHAVYCNFPTPKGNGSYRCNCGVSDMMKALSDFESIQPQKEGDATCPMETTSPVSNAAQKFQAPSAAAELHYVTLIRSQQEQAEIESGIHAEPYCSPDPSRSAAEKPKWCQCNNPEWQHTEAEHSAEHSEQSSCAKATDDKQEWTEDTVYDLVAEAFESGGEIRAGELIAQRVNAASAAERQAYENKLRSAEDDTQEWHERFETSQHHLLSAQAALKELQDERAKDKDLPKV